jgi:hypothetical protein
MVLTGICSTSRVLIFLSVLCMFALVSRFIWYKDVHKHSGKLLTELVNMKWTAKCDKQRYAEWNDAIATRHALENISWV